MRDPERDKNSAHHMEYFQDEIIDIPDLQQVDVLVQKDKGGRGGVTHCGSITTLLVNTPNDMARYILNALLRDCG